MGNASSSDSEEELQVDYNVANDEESTSDCEHDDKDVTATLDFQSLFDHASLRSAVARVKDEMPENVIQQHQPYLVRWLEERIARNETVLTRAQFCDVLLSQHVTREEALQAFRQFDSEQDGEIDMATLLEGLKSTSNDMHADLGYIVRTLQACSLTPGFIDVYSEHTDSLGYHGSRLLNFLQQNRAPVASLPFPYLTGFNNTMDMRLAALNHHFHSLKDSANLQQEEGMLSDGEELKPITRCFKSMEVSTNKSDVYKLTNGEPSTYWQSDGPARSHWIRLRMRNNVVIKQLSVSVAACDQSYMPQCITVSVGKNCLSLREIKDVKVPSHITGEVNLLENCKQFYPVIQINVKRCHSDGCDTRIHGLKTLGYRIIKENGVSVMDASVSWYLQVMSSTAIMTMPLAPHLQRMLLDHSLSALKHMGPLSLCPNSSEKPAFLSSHVLNEICSFLARIAVDQDGKILPEGLYIQLAFNLARGHVAGVLNNLLQLQKNDHLELDAGTLLKNLKSVRDSFWKRQGAPLQVGIAGCDGGEKEEGSSVKNILNSNWTSGQAYLSGDGKTMVNVFLKAPDYIQLTKLRIKVGKGAKGPKRGMIFVYQDKEPFNLEKHVERFQTYDGWTGAEYGFCSKVRMAGLGGMPDNPVAYFTMEDDWDEVDITPDVCPVGQYILIKFLEPRQPSAERLSVVGIKFYGFQRKAVFYNNDLSIQENEVNSDSAKPTPTVTSAEIIHLKLLDFLVALARDQTPPKKSGSSRKPQALDMAEMDISLIWEVYQGYKDRNCRNLTLQLLHVMFPFLTEVKDHNQDQREAFFEHLCRTVDEPDAGLEEGDIAVIKQVIIDGAAVFFPDKEARRKQLFSMMTDINTTAECQSVALIFHSLCQFFSIVDPSGLLDLPSSPDESFDMGPVLAVMDMLMSVAFRDFTNALEESELTEQASHLVHLLCSLQTSLLVWVHQRTEGQACSVAEEVLVKYFALMSEKLSRALENLVTCHQKWEVAACQGDITRKDKVNRPATLENLKPSASGVNAGVTNDVKSPMKQVTFKADAEVEKKEDECGAAAEVESKECDVEKSKQDSDESKQESDKEETKEESVLESKVTEMLAKLEKTFLATSVRQMLLIVNMMCNQLSSLTRVEILKSLMPVLESMKAVARKMSNVCYTIDSAEWDQIQCGEVILRTWEVESMHNYENNQHNTEVFSCPGASTFIVDFDPRCETEKRYDYLEFTDSRGVKSRYDQKVGNDKWPTTVTFKGGHRLRFLFHSDSSNNEWGYKFRVTALGCPDITLNWLFDLELSLCKVCGAYSGATLDSKLVTPKLKKPEAVGEEGEADMHKSELWTTLFRGGYMAGRLQRSLSGKFMTDEDEVATVFLLDMVEGSDKGATQNMEAEFLKKCQSQYGMPDIGGADVTETITAIFAALLWHTQHLRDEINNYVQKKGEGGIKDGILQTYSAAESLRTILVEQRQQWNLARSQNTCSSEEVNPVAQCKEKALFLLKFAGLTKLPSRSDSRGKLARRISTVNRLPNASQGRSIKMEGIFEKYPAFQLVLEFVSDPKWSLSRVQEMLKRGSNQAKAVSQVYSFAADFLELMSDGHVFQIPTVLYLQELLRHQINFAKHYADDLEGCGLDLESRVRGSYYKFVKCLVDALRAMTRSNLKKTVVYAYDYIQACTLHFLDIKWQPFDLFFLDELEIPEFFVSLAKGSVSMREKLVGEIDEDAEVALYVQEMEWLQECKKDFYKWYERGRNCGEVGKKTMQMFVAKYCDLLEVEISCDGCGVTLPGRRYRCLQCEDTDLCATCYAGGVKPRGEHVDDHEIVHMMYKCDECQAFIVGTRIHCSTCEDFDLCLGCHKMHHFPAGHDADHFVIRIPTVRLKLNKESDTSLQSYVHQHVWLLFSSLALSMANIIYSSGRQTATDLDGDYTKVAIKLHNSCMNLSFHCLMLVSAQDDADGDILSDFQSRQQRAFAVHSQERIMGLLGAMIPPENKANISEDVNCTFKSVEFFKLLFTIAMGESDHEANTKHMTMDLIGQLLTKGTVSCAVCDEAITMAKNEPVPEDAMPGQHTAKLLFSYGANCLEKSGLNWANSMASILQQLLGCSAWKDVLLSQLVKSINILIENPMAFQPALPESMKDTTLVSKLDLMNLLIYQKGLTGDKAQEIWNLASSDGESADRWGFAQALRLCADVKNGKELPRAILSADSQSKSALSSIFALFVVAGFPEVLSVGSQVRYTDVANETKNGVVLKHFPDKNQSLIIDKKSRKRFMVNDEHVQCQRHETQVLDPELIQAFVKVIHIIAAKVKQGKSSEESVSTEHTWLLYLALKALLHVLQQETEVKIPDLFTPQFIQCIVHLASQSSSFSKQWLLKDLEILSLKLYTGSKLQDEIPEKDKLKDKDKEKNKEKEKSTEPKVTEEITESGLLSMQDLTHQDRLFFYTLNEYLKIPLPMLRAIYELNGKNVNAVLVNIQSSMDGEVFQPSAELEEESKKWESAAESQGILNILEGVIGDVAESQKDEPKSVDTAEPEQTEENQKLIASSNDANKETSKQRKTYSAALLRKARETHGQAEYKVYLRKVNMAIAVQYARQLLTKLLADWPGDGHVITAQLIGCRDSTQVPYILDFLNTSDNNVLFKKVVENVVTQSKEKTAFALTACHFMQDVNLVTVAKESEHNYKENTDIQDKVHIPGASFLVIRFDSRCNTEEACDELTMSSSEDFPQDSRRVFSGSREYWENFQIPGDTLFYKFVSDSTNNRWGYKFTVTGGRLGRFETGYLILRCILSKEDVICDLPQEELWRSLVYVANKQTGEQRLKALHLLIKLMQAQFRLHGCSALRLDLSLLRPLWQLYNSMADSTSEGNHIMSQLSRALTEFFFIAENLALDWGVEKQYVISLLDDLQVQNIVFKGMLNIAALSASVGLENKATEAVTNLISKTDTNSLSDETGPVTNLL